MEKSTLKKIIFVIGCLFLFTNAYSQREVIEHQQWYDNSKWHYGYYLGLNQNDFKISYNTPNFHVQSKPAVGFNVGIVAGLKLHNNIDIRLEPGLMTNTKTLYFNNIATETDSVRKVGGTYLHVPLILKLNANRFGNIRPYVLGGVAYDYNFSSNQDNPDDNLNGEFRMKKHNFMYEIGIGTDIYLPWFVMSPSIRGVFAIKNEIKYDEDPNSQWTAPIEFLGNRGIFFKITVH